LQDPLILCSGSCPGWVSDIMHHFSFLIPLDTRRLYLTCTSFGLIRAMTHIHETGRIPRQKVSVSRENILESAKKIMEIYAKHKSVLEVAYFSEVGVGLGPTLEFYTLVSHELQRKDLGLWLDGTEPVSTTESQEQQKIEEDSQEDLEKRKKKKKLRE